jgi:hypothetical protein
MMFTCDSMTIIMTCFKTEYKHYGAIRETETTRIIAVFAAKLICRSLSPWDNGSKSEGKLFGELGPRINCLANESIIRQVRTLIYFSWYENTAD